MADFPVSPLGGPAAAGARSGAAAVQTLASITQAQGSGF